MRRFLFRVFSRLRSSRRVVSLPPPSPGELAALQERGHVLVLYSRNYAPSGIESLFTSESEEAALSLQRVDPRYLPVESYDAAPWLLAGMPVLDPGLALYLASSLPQA